MDMDLDDLDGPTQAPSRPTRFAPKNSKFKPKPKTEQLAPPQSQELDSNSIHLSAKEELLDSETPSFDSSRIPKVENESLCPSSSATVANGNGTVNLDTEFKPEDDEPKEDLMEEDNHHEEEEDHVVREIDVFFTPSMDSNTQLYVLQYPLKPCWRPYEIDERCEEVRVKPTTSEIEIDLSVDVDSKNYDPDPDNGIRMTKQILSSSWKPPHRSGYAVGVLIGNKLHLNPIQAVVQLRPSMQHFRSGGSRKQNKQPGDLNEPHEESWVPLKYHGAKSDASSRYLHKMVAEEGSNMQFLMLVCL